MNPRYPRRVRTGIALGVALGLSVAIAWSGRAAISATSASTQVATPAVQLVESIPVESGLGDPSLPSAATTWVEMIRSATRSLDIEEFYLSNWPGEPMEDVLAAIRSAAKRGVRVRMLLDAGMHGTYPQPAESLGTISGIEVRWIAMRPIAGGIQHSKYFLVDDRESYVGSQNFDWRSLKHIHELGVRVRDKNLTAAFREVFDLDWEAAGAQAAGRDSSASALKAQLESRPRRSYPLRLVQAVGDTVVLWPGYTPRGFIPDTTRWDLDAIVAMLDRARSEIALQLLSYSPKERNEQDDALDAALRRAAARGVKVRMIISDWESDSPRIKTLQSLAQVANVEAKLSTVPDWSGGYVPFARVEHCKYVVVDSLWTWVGTSNWEPGYFHGSRNLGVTMLNRPIALQARGIFQTSWMAPGAAAVNPDSAYTRKNHGMTPPPGRTAYGR